MVFRATVSNFEIILGTYENFLLGYIFKCESKELVHSFATHAHQGSVRAIASSNEYVASGGTDEIIQLFDMGYRKITGSIMHHSGSITSLQFTPDGSHLVSTSEDGSIAVYKTKTWELDKLWSDAHQGSGVKCISIHPTGKLALSVAENRSLKTWNLIKGRAAYTTNLSHLSKCIDQVIWSTKGSYYAVPVDYRIHVFDVSVAGIKCVINCASKITTTAFLQDNIVIFGEKDGWVIGYDVENDKELWKLRAANTRIKCLATVSSDYLISSSSDGELAVWKFISHEEKPTKVTSVNCDCRILCMSVHYSPETKS